MRYENARTAIEVEERLRHWPGRVVVGVLLALSVSIGTAGFDAAWGQTGKAVVTGAARIVVRRGPGRQYPPFAAVSRGESVDVQEMKGEWARITTRRGESGYVNSTFLALPNEQARRPVPTPTDQGHRAAPVVPTATATVAVAPAALVPTVVPPTTAPAEKSDAGPARIATLEAEVRRLRDELAAARSRTPAPAAAVPVVGGRDIEPVREQLQQAVAALDALQRRVEAGGTPAEGTESADTDASSVLSSHTLVLLVLGMLVGWVAHLLYGRSSDRGYRSRIRF